MALNSAVFDLQPTLIGPSITLRPLQADDFDVLQRAASDPLIWEQHPDPTRYQREVFRERFFTGGLASGSAFVVLENASGRVIGSSRYYEWDPAKREVSIGYTFLVRDCWGGTTNTEMKRLMLAHAFQWAEVVWLHIGIANRRSRKAAEKIGAVFSHVEDKTVNGAVLQTAFYRIDRSAVR
jgi:RimJ/RimL family protein N-acetyltransferase